MKETLILLRKTYIFLNKKINLLSIKNNCICSALMSNDNCSMLYVAIQLTPYVTRS